VTITHSLELPDSPLGHWVSATAKRADSADMEVVVTVRVSELPAMACMHAYHTISYHIISYHIVSYHATAVTITTVRVSELMAPTSPACDDCVSYCSTGQQGRCTVQLLTEGGWAPCYIPLCAAIDSHTTFACNQSQSDAVCYHPCLQATCVATGELMTRTRVYPVLAGVRWGAVFAPVITPSAGGYDRHHRWKGLSVITHARLTSCLPFVKEGWILARVQKPTSQCMNLNFSSS
jgi:hypothetical protein